MLFALLVAGALADSASYADAIALYRKVELEESLVRFEGAEADARDDAERAHLRAWIGLVRGQLGDLEGARAAFVSALALDASIEIPAPAPPAVTQVLAEARRAALPSVAPAAPAAPSAAPAAPPSTLPMVATVTGGALVVAGAAIFVIGLDSLFRQAFAAEFQSEAVALRDLGHAELATGGVVVALGAATLGTGVALHLIE